MGLVYLATSGCFLWYMYVNMPYVDPLGYIFWTWSSGTSFQEYISYHDSWGKHFHLFWLMNYTSLNKPPVLFVPHHEKKHLLISWLFRVIKWVILFPPRTSERKKIPHNRASLTWKESYILNRWTSLSHTLLFVGSSFMWRCFEVPGGLCWWNLHKQQQTSQGSESHSNEIWLFKRNF